MFKTVPRIAWLACVLAASAWPTPLSAETPPRTATLPPADQRFAASGVTETPDFQRHVVPLLGRLGCNGRNCHGSFQGRGGMRLSLFGYDFKMDHAALTGDATSERGKRIRLDDIAESLMLQKPLGQVEHEGGQRFDPGSWEHRLLQRWIEGGGQAIGKQRELNRLEIQPSEVVYRAGGADVNVRLRVVAVWEDDVREEVTPLCRFRTNDDSVVTVDAQGQLQSTGAGDTHVVAFYDNGIAAVPVMRPVDSVAPVVASENAEPGIDSFVHAKLGKLGLIASEVCTDAEFLRRLSLDVTGTLPTPSEVEAFLVDESTDKRERKIAELLERPTYAAWWANKLCDFTGCNPNQQAELGQELSVQWYMWMYQQLRENLPYDELVRRIVLATSRESEDHSFEQYTAGFSAYFRSDDASDFSRRETMPHYWTRRNMQKPEDAAQAFAHNFLGIRLQCAQCHKHPFAAWTQQDFKEFGRFFESLSFGVRPEDRPAYRDLAQRVGLQLRGDNGSAVRSDVLRRARKGDVIPWRELYLKPREHDQSMDLLRSGTVNVSAGEDPRAPIMDWMSQADNPWFARALVNRVWAGYFNVGIVDPPDDLSPANPPSNPALLNWLTEGFIQQGYDLKWLHRVIVSSDTYQRSWRPSPNNRADKTNYSRKIPRRMPAEMVYDSVKQVLAANDQQEEVRADLTRRASGHLSMRLAGTYAMRVFGKPDRMVNCDCERDNQPNLLQAVFLHNDPLIDQRLEASGWIDEIKNDESAKSQTESLIRQAWMRSLSRPPQPSEIARAKRHLSQSDSIEVGMRDLLWALMNTKEFLLIK